MTFEYAIRAAQGARSYQEDAAAVRPEVGGLVAVLADGMGGHAGGAVASEEASASFLNAFATASAPTRRDVQQDAPEACKRLFEALDSANAAIAHRAAESPELDGMGCTLVGVAFRPGCVEWISVGDSPLYLVRGAEIRRLNEDHSLAPEIDRMAESGRISWDTAMASPHRHVLRSALTGAEIELIDVPQAPLTLESGDRVVLASDGIHSISDADIARIVAAAATPDTAAEALIAAVAAAGNPHQDNTTVVVVWCVS